MEKFANLFTFENVKFIAIRVLLCGAVLLIYFSVWRPARLAVTEYVVYPQVQAAQTSESIYRAEMRGGSMLVVYEYGDSTKQLSYRPEFGFFFILALMSFFFITTQKKHYYLLLGLHLAASILIYFFLLLGIAGFTSGFVLMDAIGSYVTPGISLALVPIVMSDK